MEILTTSYNGEESASVTFDDRTVTVTGIIRGNNGCYTARLNEAVIENDRLVVSIESYEDAAENQDCLMAPVFIEDEVAVNTPDDTPTEASVEHNGEPITTRQRS